MKLQGSRLGMHLAALTRAGQRLGAGTGLSLARPLGPLLTPCKSASWPMTQRERQRLPLIPGRWIPLSCYSVLSQAWRLRVAVALGDHLPPVFIRGVEIASFLLLRGHSSCHPPVLSTASKFLRVLAPNPVAELWEHQAQWP